MRLTPVLGVLVAASLVLAGISLYENSLYSTETGVADSLSNQVDSLTVAPSSYSTEVSALSSSSTSLESQLAQAQANVTSLTTLRGSLQTQISRLGANITSLTTTRDSLQTQLSQSEANATALDGQVNSLTSQVTALNGQIATLNSQVASLSAQVSAQSVQIASYQSIVGLSVTNTLVNSQSFSVPAPPSGECYYVPLLPASYSPKYGGYLLISGTTNSTLSYAFVTFPAPLSETVAYYLGTTASTPIPIMPGNVIVHLDNCGAGPMSASLTVTEVT